MFHPEDLVAVAVDPQLPEMQEQVAREAIMEEEEEEEEPRLIMLEILVQAGMAGLLFVL